jgi:hypothetical protein
MTTYLSPSHNLSALQRTVFMLVSGLVIALLQVLLQSTVSFAAPTTFTVTNTSDTGAGSLRQAIDDANKREQASKK